MEEKTETFIKKRGTVDKGKLYENVVLTKIVTELLEDKKIRDFYISSNNENFGLFDDIVIKLEYHDKSKKLQAIQLKHNHNKNELTIYNLQGFKRKEKSNALQKDTNFDISRYFESFEKIEENVDELILFTNQPFNPPEEEFNLEKCQLCIKPVKVEDDVYQFRITNPPTPNTEKYSDFFRKFYLKTNQENVEDMKKTVAAQFTKTYSSSEEKFNQFLSAIVAWNMQDQEVQELNKKWMERLISLQLLSSAIVPLSPGPVDNKMKTLRKAISSFQVVVFEEESLEKVGKLWGDFISDKKIDFKKLNKQREMYLPTISPISTTDSENINVDTKTFTQLLWLMNECSLILRECENVEEAFEFWSDKTFILITKDKNKIDTMRKRYYTVFQNLSDLTFDLRENVMQDFRISIQGKEEINLATAFGSNTELVEIVTTDNLVEMLNGPCRIGGEQETLPEPYITRSLSRNVVNFTYLDKVHDNTIIVLNTANNVDKVELHKYKLIDIDNFLQDDSTPDNFNLNKASTIYVVNRNDFEIQQFCNEKIETENIHYFKISSDGNLEWIQSKGDVSDLEGYKYSINEDALWCSRLDNNINLITANPGMGKSELMKSFKNKCPPKYWTVIINPKDVDLFFHELRFTQTNSDVKLFEKNVLNEKCNLNKKLDKNFFEMCVKKNALIIIWDALDEILGENLDKVGKIILDFSTKGLRQWVTSRRHLKESLEKKFNLFSFSINPFDEQNQIEYITKRLNSFNSQDKIQNVEYITSSCALIQHSLDLLGIPRHIFMVTELFRQNNTFLLTELYDYIIDENFNIFCKDKLQLNTIQLKKLNMDNDKRKILKVHKRVALKVIFSSEILKNFNIGDLEKYVEKISLWKRYLSLTNEKQNDTPRFLQTSFAEYFVAKYFSDLINNFKVIYADILFVAKYNNVRFFFDMLLVKNSKAHKAVLYKQYESLQKYDDKILTDKDEGGRSVLHLMSSWGKRHPRLKVTCEEREVCKEYTVQEDSSFDGKAETEVYFVTLEHLLTKINVDDKDLLLEETPLSYAIRSESLGAELKLLQTKKNECNQLNVSNDTVNIIYYSTLLGYDGVFKLFIAEQLKNFWDKAKIVIARDLETPQSLAHYIVRNYPVDTAEQNRYEQLIEYFKQIKCIDDTEQSGTSLYKFPKRMRKN